MRKVPYLVEDLSFAAKVVPALGVLKGRDVHYQDLANAIGLKRQDEKWNVRHRTRIGHILYLAGGAKDAEPGLFDRIVHEADGEPGAGLYNEARLVIVKPEEDS